MIVQCVIGYVAIGVGPDTMMHLICSSCSVNSLMNAADVNEVYRIGCC
jgi:hypothetical protein